MPARSIAQQRLFGMVLAAKRGKLKRPSAKVAEVAAHVSEESAHDFASTKDKGLPNRKKKKKRVAKALVGKTPGLNWKPVEGDESNFHEATARGVGRYEVGRRSDAGGFTSTFFPKRDAYYARYSSGGTVSTSPKKVHATMAAAKRSAEAHYQKTKSKGGGPIMKKMRKAARFDLSHATRTCDMCGTVFGGGATRCPACGHEHMDRLVGGVPTVVGKPVAARVSKSAPRMRPCENCGMMMSRTSKRCSKCGYANEVRKSQGGSPFQKALAVATPAQKEDALKTLAGVNVAVSAALAKVRGRGA